MEHTGVGESSATAQAESGGADEATVAAGRDEPSPEREVASEEHDRLLAELQRLTMENARYREHAERTSKLFLAVTDYADWVRERARHDAELALRKARARAERLETTTRELEQSERERARLEEELATLRALVGETRARLSEFLAGGLKALDAETGARRLGAEEPAFRDLESALHSQLGSSATGRELGADG
jgi:hypothetical protein